MAIVWPSKNNFANGDVLTATNMNNIADTLNVYNPTSATNGQVPIANGSGGVSFGTLVTGAFTSIASGSLTTATTTISSIPATYQHLYLVVRDVTRTPNTLSDCEIRFNGDTGSNYGRNAFGVNNGTVRALVGATTSGINTVPALSADTADREFFLICYVWDYAKPVRQSVFAQSAVRDNSGNMQTFHVFGTYQIVTNAPVAINSLTINNTSAPVTGTYELFGMK